MNSNTAAAPRFTVVYARGAVHIQGLAEKTLSSLDSLNYSYSACAALTKNKAFWCTEGVYDTAAEALAAAEAKGRRNGKGVCKNCAKRAAEVAAAQAATPAEETYAEKLERVFDL